MFCVKPILNVFFVFSILSFCGCSIFPETQPAIPVSYFDIGCPDKMEQTAPLKEIEIQNVKTTDPYNERMVFRDSDTHIQIDDYNRWASLPNEMLKKYLILAFNQNNTGKLQKSAVSNLDLYATIICLESDLRTNDAKMAILIEIRDDKKGDLQYTEFITDSERIDKMSAESFASAVKIMTDRMIKSLAKNVSQIKIGHR